MYGRNWLKRFTPKIRTGVLVAVITLTAGVPFLVKGSNDVSEYEWRSNERAIEYADYTYGPAYDACLRLPPNDQPNCIGETAQKRRENERQEQDLVAQQTMSVWTAIMGAAAVIGMMLSAFGVFLIWGTWMETKFTNSFLMAGEKRTNEAKISLPSPITLTSHDMMQMSIFVQNLGGSRAENVNISFLVQILNGNGEVANEESVISRPCGIEVESKQHVRFENDFATLKIQNGAVRGENAVMSAKLTYETEYGERIITDYRFEGQYLAGDGGIIFDVVPGTKTRVEPAT